MIDRYYVKLLLGFALIPAILLCSLCFWGARLACNSISRNVFQQRYTATVIIVVFLSHPTISKVMFSVFDCRSIDGIRHLYSNMDIVCYTGGHQVYALAVGLPGLFLWVLGVPLLVYIKMKGLKDQLGTEDARQKYGFLFNGYRKNAYYWEVVNMLRKTSIIFISIFAEPLGSEMQGMVLLPVLALFLTYNVARRPYTLSYMNLLENLSLGTQVLTIYCGLYFVQKTYQVGEFVLLVLFLVILGANLCFLVLWLYLFCKELRLYLQSKLPSLYLNLCLCGKRKIFKREQDRLAQQL